MALTAVKGVADWAKARKNIETAVFSVMGKLPKELPDIQTKIIDEVDFPGYSRKRINYFVDSWTRVSAWLFVPEGREVKPAILCCHDRTHRGKDEPAGIDGKPFMAFAQHYAEFGYVTLAPDSITAGDRVSSGLEPFDTRQFYRDYPKYSAMGKMLWDHMRALDVLTETRGVDAARMGVVGHDMGGYNALMLAAFDERAQVCVASGAFTCFHDDTDPGRWARDKGFALLPKLQPAIESKAYPFDWCDVLALAAPSPLLILTALNDEVLPNTRSCERAVREARRVYKILGAESMLQNFTHKGGHTMTRETVDAADEWFERWL